LADRGKLGSVGSEYLAKAVEHVDRKATGIRLGFKHQGRNRIENRLRDPPLRLAEPRHVSGHFTAIGPF